MYIVQSIVEVPVDKVEEVIGIYRNRSRTTDTAPGFVAFQLLQNEVKPYELTVQTTWENKEFYTAWVTGAAFKRIHDLEKRSGAG